MSLSSEHLYHQYKVRQEFGNTMETDSEQLLTQKAHSSSSFSLEKKCLTHTTGLKDKVKKFADSVKFSCDNIKSKIISKKNDKKVIVAYNALQDEISVLNKQDLVDSNIESSCLSKQQISENTSSSLSRVEKTEGQDNNYKSTPISNNEIKYHSKELDLICHGDPMSIKKELEKVYRLERQKELDIATFNTRFLLIQSKNTTVEIQNLESKINQLRNNIALLKVEQKSLEGNRLILMGMLRPITTALINLNARSNHVVNSFNRRNLESQQIGLETDIAILDSKISINLSEILLLEKQLRISEHEIRILKNNNNTPNTTNDKVPIVTFVEPLDKTPSIICLEPTKEITTASYNEPIIDTFACNKHALKQNNISFYTKNITSILCCFSTTQLFSFISKTNMARLRSADLERVQRELFKLDLLRIVW